MLVMGSITTLLHDHWELTAFVRGLMVSIVFCGFSAGNVLSGFIGDGHGRKPSILLAYVLIGGFGLATSATWSPASMVVLRFFVGVGCGVGFPSVYSLIPEVCPTELRGVTSSGTTWTRGGTGTRTAAGGRCACTARCQPSCSSCSLWSCSRSPRTFSPRAAARAKRRLCCSSSRGATGRAEARRSPSCILAERRPARPRRRRARWPP